RPAGSVARSWPVRLQDRADAAWPRSSAARGLRRSGGCPDRRRHSAARRGRLHIEPVRSASAIVRRSLARATLRLPPHEGKRTAWGRCGSLLLHRSGLTWAFSGQVVRFIGTSKNSDGCFGIQGLSPFMTWLVPHQIKLTSGRHSKHLHQYPAFGGWGSGGRDHSFTRLFKPVRYSVSIAWIRQDRLG